MSKGNHVRLIYTDEAGTSPAEPVRVVASVIVHGDNEARVLTAEMERIFDERVPAHLRDGFIFHAKDLFNPQEKLNYGDWSFDDRLDLIKEVVCLPFVHDVPIALGIWFSGLVDIDDEMIGTFKAKKLSVAAYEHGLAFAKCIERADLFLRKYLGGSEVGTIIAEDVNEKRKLLGKMALLFKHMPTVVGPELQHQTKAEQMLGIQPGEVTQEVTNIIDVPHFVSKDGAPLLQLADACAFSFRRFLSKYKHGDQLVLAMLGPGQGGDFITDPVWFSGGCSGLFNTEKYWSAEQREEFAQSNAQLRAIRAGALAQSAS